MFVYVYIEHSLVIDVRDDNENSVCIQTLLKLKINYIKTDEILLIGPKNQDLRLTLFSNPWDSPFQDIHCTPVNKINLHAFFFPRQVGGRSERNINAECKITSNVICQFACNQLYLYGWYLSICVPVLHRCLLTGPKLSQNKQRRGVTNRPGHYHERLFFTFIGLKLKGRTSTSYFQSCKRKICYLYTRMWYVYCCMNI
jgi:hypothetical protein